MTNDHEAQSGLEPQPPSDEALGFAEVADAGSKNNVATNSYQVLARKYRPRSFTDLVGQEAMVQTLVNAFESGRVAHAFMLTGVRGVGKTTTARILARALNYEGEGHDGPSMALDQLGVHCEAIMQGAHVDVIEMDAASRTGIDDIREIIENVRYAPAAARFKVYIIDEVHMLSKAAFNGLLKTLEEPPAHVKFIFATTEIRQVPVTVLSRCQRFDLRRLTQDDTQALLAKTCAAEGVSLPEEALALIARAADGSARDALSLLDRALAHGGNDDGAMDTDTMRTLLGLADRGRIFDLFDLLMRARMAEALAEFEAQYQMGADPAVILADLAELTHWLTRLKFVEGAGDDVTFSPDLRRRGQQAAEQLSTPVLSRVWQILLNGYDEALRAMNVRAAAEMVLIRIAHLATGPTPEELVKQLERLPPDSTPVPVNPPAATPVGTSAGAPTVSVPSNPSNSSNPTSSTSYSVQMAQDTGGRDGPSAPPVSAMMPSSRSQQVSSQMPDQTGRSPPSGGGVMQAETVPATEQSLPRAPILQDFQALVDLAGAQRELGLKRALEHGVHLVKFEPAHGGRAGRVEIRLVEGEENIAQYLTQKLRQWTGQNWVVSLSSTAGAKTLASTRVSATERRYAAALDDPHVKAALVAFPDAEIVAVTDFSSDSGPCVSVSAPANDGETDDNEETAGDDA